MESAILVIVFGSWFFLSIIKQFLPKYLPNWFQKVIRLDVFSLVPIWTFFAPNPGRYDYRVLIKDKYLDGSEGAWEEIPIVQKRGIISALWNPHKRLTKAICDAVQEIAISRESSGKLYDNTFFIHLPHLFFLNFVLNHQGRLNVTERKYSIVATHGFHNQNNIEIIAKSQYYKLSEGQRN